MTKKNRPKSIGYSEEEKAYLLEVRRQRLNETLFGSAPELPKTPMEIAHRVMANPEQARAELVKSICRDSFYEFVKMAWHTIERVPFVEGRAIREVANALQAITEGKIKRLLINIPPGFSKSSLLCIFWPAWEWGPRNNPHYRYISASYEQGLATRDLIRSRDLIKSAWYQRYWPIALKEDQNEKTLWSNTQFGWRKSSSVGGTLTGYRGDRLLIDDPHDAKRARSEIERDLATNWWTETIQSRLNDPARSAIVLIMQRLHVADISGHILSKTPDGWSKLILPMEYEPNRHCSMPEIGFEDWRTTPGELLWPERFTREVVDDLKREMSSKHGAYVCAGQLQQSPIPETGGLFKSEFVQIADSTPANARRCRGWDLAATQDGGDWTAGALVALHQGKIYIDHVVRLQGSSARVVQTLKDTAAQDTTSAHISIPQDPGQAGKHQKTSLAAELAGYDVHFSLESGSKTDRARPLAAQWEAGNVFLVRGPWNDAFLTEMALFPSGRGHDDQVDATTRAYARLLMLAQTDQISLTPGYSVENHVSSLDGY